MPIQKISTDDPVAMTGFVVTDLAGAERATGVVRSAKKILMDGAKTMARSQSYAWAILGEQISGASAGISVDPANNQAGIAAFADAVLERVSAGELSLDPAKGVSASDLSGLSLADTRSSIGSESTPTGTLNQDLLAAGAFAAAASAYGSLEGRRITVEGTVAHSASVISAAISHGVVVVGFTLSSGARVRPEGFDLESLLQQLTESGEMTDTDLGAQVSNEELLEAPTDLLLCGSKLGLIDHSAAEALGCKVIIPTAPAVVTAKGLAVATRRNINVLPDFVTTSGPLFADHPTADSSAEHILGVAAESISNTIAALLQHPEGPYLAGCYAAEEFLMTWQQELPFGRPLA
ncbi:MAG: hypothetical protein WD029_08535 [Microthrixaceae bacterium]